MKQNSNSMSNKLLLKSYVGGADNMFFQPYMSCLYFECQLNFHVSHVRNLVSSITLFFFQWKKLKSTPTKHPKLSKPNSCLNKSLPNNNYGVQSLSNDPKNNNKRLII
jgi:hypothetical protein